MARKQVLVQLDDELVERLDALAATMEVSRSELLRRGAEAVLVSEDAAAADRALVEAYRHQPVDRSFVEAVSALSSETSPEW